MVGAQWLQSHAPTASGPDSPGADPVDVGPPPPPHPEQTGDPAVDQAVARVAEAVARGSDLQELVAVVDAAHRTLQDRLADLEG